MRLSATPGMYLGEGARAFGAPQIHIQPGSTVTLGAAVALTSRRQAGRKATHQVSIRTTTAEARIVIGTATHFHASSIHAATSVTIGRRCRISAGCQIMDFIPPDSPLALEAGALASGPQPVVIGDEVQIGANCIILPGTCIASGSVITAGSVVSGEVLPVNTGFARHTNVSAPRPLSKLRLSVRAAAELH